MHRVFAKLFWVCEIFRKVAKFSQSIFAMYCKVAKFLQIFRKVKLAYKIFARSI